MNLNDKIEAMLEKVQKAPRYTGGEMNTQVKSWDEAPLHFCFCFPDTYEVGMSHLGMKILTGLINDQPWSLCERCFMPWVDMMDLMKQEGVPLFSLESRRPLREFDAVGFTLMYEMSYSNVLAMLDMGGIPVERRDRGEDDPIVVAGGGCASNPEPISDFIDAFLIGAGEKMNLEVNRVILRRKEEGWTRQECLKQLARIEGVYVPSLYEAEYNADGTLQSFRPVDPAAPERVVKRYVADFDKAYFPTKVAVPYTEVVFDRITLEIMRGCTRGCRFCQAGMLYRPVRERRLETLVRQAETLVDATGYEEISLSSLSSGDYTCLPELIRELMHRMKDRRVSISLPSLRIDSVLKESLEETQQVKKSSLTFAPEAGTQRLRDVINKGVTEEDLIEKARDAFRGGWSSIKLYFMDGLPTETYEDLDGIADLARKVVAEYFNVPKAERAKGLRVTVSCSTFVPKPHTPFQWAAQDTIPVIDEKQEHLREVLKIKGVNFNWHAPHLSFLEACFSRGDRRLGRVLKRAWERGCMLDGWNDQFKFGEWMAAFADCGLDPAFYANRERGKDELLPWDFLDCGVTKEFLWREKEKSDRAEVTRDCRLGCNGCGIQRIPGLCAYADPKRRNAPSPSLVPYEPEGGEADAHAGRV
ncbi:MAG: TIGR03960 family B12-binding radical SAM protein [Clostridiales bacterium]|nr:TIGR03960 family B12-binding radical SAM protein [Clostridiales bacterium]